MAEARPYDLVLLDMAMPGVDGLELARIITSDELLAPVRMLLLSSEPVDADAATRAGFVARLTKPIRLSYLYDALVRAIAPAAMAEAVGPAPPPAIVGWRGTLLIVEDHAINQQVAQGIAAKLGYRSDVAGDGIEALAALERRSYDAVLMDCHMPEMDGFEATVAIRRREAEGQRHVPIIAMTAGALAEDREKCIVCGMDDYLAKPVKAHQMEAVLKRWARGGDEPLQDQGDTPRSSGESTTCWTPPSSPPCANWRRIAPIRTSCTTSSRGTWTRPQSNSPSWVRRRGGGMR